MKVEAARIRKLESGSFIIQKLVTALIKERKESLQYVRYEW